MKKLLCPKNIIDSDLCIGCGSCAYQATAAGMRGEMKFDRYGQLKPAGKWCNEATEDFTLTCPFSPGAVNEDQLADELFPVSGYHSSTGKYSACYAGYAARDNFRMEGSSGGIVSWMACELLRRGMVDAIAHVVAVNYPQEDNGRLFRFRISRNEKEISEGAKSRYYPVEMSEILKIIREVPGRYAIVAVPCMIKSIQLLRRRFPEYRESIKYTLGLFCGHLKSSSFSESIAWQMKVQVKNMKGIDFRFKHPERPANWYNAMIFTIDGDTKNKDWWQMVDGDWGAGFFMNPACNFCDDVMAETADISFGDAWVKPYNLDGKGTNVIILRNDKIKELIQDGIRDSSLELEEVHAELVSTTQAAGLRMRREGLAFRLTLRKRGIKPVKRVFPHAEKLSRRRRTIYLMRNVISKWSHRYFRLSKMTGIPMIYLTWARIMTSIYHGMVYHGGNFKEIRKRYLVMKRG